MDLVLSLPIIGGVTLLVLFFTMLLFAVEATKQAWKKVKNAQYSRALELQRDQLELQIQELKLENELLTSRNGYR